MPTGRAIEVLVIDQLIFEGVKGKQWVTWLRQRARHSRTHPHLQGRLRGRSRPGQPDLEHQGLAPGWQAMMAAAGTEPGGGKATGNRRQPDNSTCAKGDTGASWTANCKSATSGSPFSATMTDRCRALID